jgi:hypothetical protein
MAWGGKPGRKGYSGQIQGKKISIKNWFLDLKKIRK